MSGLLGPLLVLVFCLSQAFRDVYLGHLFQGVDFFAIILLAFLLSTAIFAPIAFTKSRAEWAIVRKHWRDVVAMNVTTAIAWNCYFFGLTHLEPSIVNTIHSGMAPLAVAVLGVAGIKLAQPQRIGVAEWASYGGIALSIAALWWVVLSGRSGVATLDAQRPRPTALGLLIVERHVDHRQPALRQAAQRSRRRLGDGDDGALHPHHRGRRRGRDRARRAKRHPRRRQRRVPCRSRPPR